MNSDTFDTLTTPQQWQATAVADFLVHKTGAYKGSPSDALTDAAAIVLAMRYAPEGDNHHNAVQCPYCNPVGMMTTCEHDWVPIEDATVTATPTGGRWCRKCTVVVTGPVALGKAPSLGTTP